MRRKAEVWCVAALLLAAPACALAASAQSVSETAVRLELTGGYVGAETLGQLERALNDTVSLAIIEQLGGDLDYVVRHQDDVVRTLGAVIGPVLSKRGFTLEELQLEPGPTTRVTVQIHLTQELAQNFSVQFYLLGNTPVIDEVVGQDKESVVAALFSTVARTPYGDTRWFSGLVTDTVEHALSGLSGYGDFEHLVLVEPGATTKVAVTFTPRPGVAAVTGYALRLSSLTLLAATLAPVRDRAAHHLQSLAGAPLSFVEPRLGQIEKAVFQDLVNCSKLASACADARLRLALRGCLLQGDLSVDSEKYLAGLSARLDLWDHGAERDYLGRLSGRLGVMPAPGLALYASADYFPAAGEAYPMLGLGKLWANRSFLGAGWDFNARSPRLQALHAFTPAVYVSADVYTDSAYGARSEFALHYRIRGFYELQLASNLDGEVYAVAAANF
jgi:hypothetical protein